MSDGEFFFHVVSVVVSGEGSDLGILKNREKLLVDIGVKAIDCIKTEVNAMRKISEKCDMCDIAMSLSQPKRKKAVKR